MINKDEYSWLILLCDRVNKTQKLNHSGPSQKQIFKLQPTGKMDYKEAAIEPEAGTAVVQLKSEA